ncbi:hypothetical protein VTK26DRAFT_7808 [Humicola hyalothermophila]
MKSSVAAAALFLAPGAWSFRVDPPTDADPNTIQGCTSWHVVSSGETCESITSMYGVASKDFGTYNPSVAESCSLVEGNSYCVAQNSSQGPSPTGPPTTSTATTTNATSTGTSTPSPIQEGMADNCDEFHFVSDGDSSQSIVSRYGIEMGDFVTWNPAVGEGSSGMSLNTYVCVHVAGYVPPPVPTPSPVQEGMVKGCTEFAYSGPSRDDLTCGSVYEPYNISWEDFYSWNPAVGENCSGLRTDTWYCVEVESG